jgi:hypothetical protein
VIQQPPQQIFRSRKEKKTAEVRLKSHISSFHPVSKNSLSPKISATQEKCRKKVKKFEKTY